VNRLVPLLLLLLLALGLAPEAARAQSWQRVRRRGARNPRLVTRRVAARRSFGRPRSRRVVIRPPGGLGLGRSRSSRRSSGGGGASSRVNYAGVAWPRVIDAWKLTGDEPPLLGPPPLEPLPEEHPVARAQAEGDAALEAGRWGEAERWYRAAVEGAEAAFAEEPRRIEEARQLLERVERKQWLEGGESPYEPFTDEEDLAARLTAEGDQAMAAGDLRAARAAYRRALLKAPFEPQARELEARLLDLERVAAEARAGARGPNAPRQEPS